MTDDLEPSSRVAPIPRLLLTIDETAKCLATSRSGIYRLIDAGQLHPIRIDGRQRIEMADIERLIREAREQS